MIGSIARRYAKAMLAVALEENTLEETAGEFQQLTALATDAEIAAALANPLLAESTRRALANTIAEQLALRPTTRNFLRVLADHRRLDQLVGITDQYQRLVDQRLGQVRATVTSAIALSEEQLRELVAVFGRITDKKVLPQMHVDPALLGGVVVDIEGKIYDGSLRTQLQGLAESIAGGRSYL